MAADMIASARAMDAKSPGSSASAEGEASETASGAAVERSTPSTVATLAAPSTPAEVEYVLFSYFCAGSGGVGDTILASSYMLCGEEVVYWDAGKEMRCKPATQRKVVDFGEAQQDTSDCPLTVY